jgi:hypothetical protein
MSTIDPETYIPINVFFFCKMYKKVKFSLLQATEAHRVVKRGSHIF